MERKSDGWSVSMVATVDMLYRDSVVLSSRCVQPIDSRGRNGPFIVRGYRSPSTLAIKMIGPAIIKSPRQLVPVYDAFRPMNQSESRINRTVMFLKCSPIPFQSSVFEKKFFTSVRYGGKISRGLVAAIRSVKIGIEK